MADNRPSLSQRLGHLTGCNSRRRHGNSSCQRAGRCAYAMSPGCRDAKGQERGAQTQESGGVRGERSSRRQVAHGGSRDLNAAVRAALTHTRNAQEYLTMDSSGQWRDSRGRSLRADKLFNEGENKMLPWKRRC